MPQRRHRHEPAVRPRLPTVFQQQEFPAKRPRPSLRTPRVRLQRLTVPAVGLALNTWPCCHITNLLDRPLDRGITTALHAEPMTTPLAERGHSESLPAHERRSVTPALAGFVRYLGDARKL